MKAKDATEPRGGGILSLSRHIYGQESEQEYLSTGMGPAVSAHVVQFHEDRSAFLDGLGEFVGATLGSGGGCIIIASYNNLQSLNQSLRANGIDCARIASEGRYVAMDAQVTLDKFIVDGRPDPRLFNHVLEPVLDGIRTILARPSSVLSAFGEMAAVLWSAGNREAAIETEHLWNELIRKHRLNFYCEHQNGEFSKESQSDAFHNNCCISSRIDDNAHQPVSSLPSASAVQAIVEDREKEMAHRKVVEEKLRRSEEFTRSIIEGSVDCVNVLDLEGRIQYMSPPGQRALGITDATQFVNRSWIDFWKEEDKARAEEAMSAARNGGVGCFQGESVTPAGLKKSWDVRISPALARNGEIERLVVVSRDVTELRDAQQLAIQSEKLAAAGRMAATIAHEINNPLEAVTNFIYLAMTAKGLPKEVCRHLEIADRELARVAQIAQQTLGFYRGNSMDRWISVADLVRDVLLVYERKLEYKRIPAIISVDPNLKVYCRQGELRQALSNLVANAIDASKEEGKLWLRAHPAQRWDNGGQSGVRITLADNGTGMSREVRERIFVPFFTTKAEVGTGIGLWATKTLIEQQGGKLSFRSRQGAKSGTTMSIFLPDRDPETEQRQN